LAFANGNSAFTVQSVSMDRDAAVVGVRAGLALNHDVRVNLDYNGLIGSNEKDHGVGLTLDWQF
jgi:subtilase-type serine protease